MIINILFFILGSILLLGFGILYMPENNNNQGLNCFLLIIISFIIVIMASFYNSEPKAIDVYQGKTTLKYTIVDGIKTDSIVVFKKQ